MRRQRGVGWGCLVVLLVLLLAACGTSRSATGTGSKPTPTPAASNRIAFRQASLYANGVNLPWIHYGNDLGGNAWGEYGFHDDATTLDRDFASMQSQGVSTARVWLFGDARAGIEFDASGMPTGLDPLALEDLDALTTAASSHHILLDLVLFDTSFIFSAQDLGGGVRGGGHADLINTGSGGQALQRTVILPLLRHLSGNRSVLAIETMSEPESCIAADWISSSCTSPISLKQFNGWTRMVAADVHRYDPGVLVTVGAASSRWISQYQGDGLDFYQVHSYGTGYAPQLDNQPASRLGLDKPVVIGEYGAAQSPAGFKDQLDAWYREGYAGAWVWSFGDIDSVGTYDGPTMTAWNAAHPATRARWS